MNRDIKVLHLIDSLGLGGAQMVIKGIFESQLNNKNIFLLALRKRETLVNIIHPNVEIIDSKKKYSFAPLKRIKKIISEEKIEILHCHLFRSAIFGIFLKIFYFPQIKLIIHEHGGIFENNNWFYKIIIYFFQNKVDLFIAVSLAIKMGLTSKARIKVSKIKVIYNFVNTKKFFKVSVGEREEKRGEYNLSAEDFVVGFVGRIIPRKGWKIFLEAAKRLSKSHLHLRFALAGSGAQKKQLIRFLKENDLISKVIYTDYVEEIEKFYPILDCLIIPSKWEGLPMVQLEAAAVEVPIISSAALGCNEIFEDNAGCLYFKNGDLNDLIEKINLIYCNDNLREKNVLQAKEVVKKFSLDNYLVNLDGLYTILTNKNEQ